MSRLPVIVGFGGINPAGRSSAHHGYRRLVLDQLEPAKAERTLASLGALMQRGKPSDDTERKFILNHTLIRKLETNLFDADSILLHKSAQLNASPSHPISFTLKRNQLPAQVPETWQVEELEGPEVKVTVTGDLDVLFPDSRVSKVHAAGQLPTGFDPETMYQSRNHPRGLQLTVYGASDAINSLGIDWQTIQNKIPGDQISVYASSAMGQLDANGNGGLLQSGLVGKRVSSKNVALGLPEMTADFVNAYILGNVGTTGANIGACATFLYNLRQGIQDIRSGKYRISVVGSSEAPLTPDVIEGYRTMGALAEDDALRKIEGIDTGEPDFRRACRPFSENCGFTLAEASQFIILFDDELAVELGANIYGSVADVFINADGFKKSIPGPGIGNYVTVGKAMGVIRSILGEDALRNRSYMSAHGTGTPQNRTTESHIFSELAKTFGIENWPVAAIKAYIGHSLACASGDQIINAIGTWVDGVIPGISTIDGLAPDVFTENVDYLLKHREIETGSMDATLVNSKGFGGNNATAAILSPDVTRKMMEKKHGKKALTKHAKQNESVMQASYDYDEAMLAGENSVIYKFGEGVIEGNQLKLSKDKIEIPGHKREVNLEMSNPYDDMDIADD
ncbi:MAG TPA: beta-ketoacyl synthase [Gammaproteobacteria bacterium]|nr:beta-ketoacyl synthase [Gammaproteobacteria bacterium]